MIAQATHSTASVLSIDGITAPIDRIPFGSEPHTDMFPPGPCADCGVDRGAVHWCGCDHEQCPNCGAQLLGCDCEAHSVDDGRMMRERADEDARMSRIAQMEQYAADRRVRFERVTRERGSVDPGL
jgi:hypothetical protein